MPKPKPASVPLPRQPLKPAAKQLAKQPAEKPPDIQQSLPEAPEAEKAVLSSIMAFPNKAISQCVEAGVQPEWFSVPAHKAIFQDLCDLHDSGGMIDLISFTQRLDDKGLLKAIGGPWAITDIQGFIDKVYNDAPSLAFLSTYIDMMRAAYIRREIIAGAALAARRAFDPDPNADMNTVLDEISSRAASLRSLHGRNGAQISFRSPSEILAMPRNQHANFLGDHLLGIALSLVLAGIGGIGKSRLLLQLLFALILERIWCGLRPTTQKLNAGC